MECTSLTMSKITTNKKVDEKSELKPELTGRHLYKILGGMFFATIFLMVAILYFKITLTKYSGLVILFFFIFLCVFTVTMAFIVKNIELTKLNLLLIGILIDNWNLWVNDIVDIENLKRYPEDSWAKVDLTIYNFGKMDSQHISCKPIEDDESYFAYVTFNKSTNNFQNVPAGTSIRPKLHIRENGKCQLQSPEGCDHPEEINLGYHKVKLDCRCKGCLTQQNFTETIEFCIYNKSEKECTRSLTFLNPKI